MSPSVNTYAQEDTYMFPYTCIGKTVNLPSYDMYDATSDEKFYIYIYIEPLTWYSQVYLSDQPILSTN